MPKSLHLLLLDMGWRAQDCMDKPHGLDSPRAGHNKNRLDKPHGLDSPRTLDIKAQVITFKHIKYYQKF